MDNNTVTPTTPPAAGSTIPPVPPAGPAPVQPPPVESEEKGGNKSVLFLVFGALAVLVIVFGIYLFLNNQMESDTQVPLASTAPQQPDLESDVNSIEVSDVDADFQEVDKDLEAL